MNKFINAIISYIKAVKIALLYENGKLSSGRLMLQFVFLMLNAFWLANFWISVNVPSSMENVFYALLAYVFGTKGVNIAKTSVNNKTQVVNTTTKPEQKTANVDSPD